MTIGNRVLGGLLALGSIFFSASATGAKLKVRADAVQLPNTNPTLVDLLANDGHDDGSPISVTVSVPANGAITVNGNGDGTVIVRRVGGEPNGEASFTYTASAGGESDTKTVRVCWGSVNCRLPSNPGPQNVRPVCDALGFRSVSTGAAISVQATCTYAASYVWHGSSDGVTWTPLANGGRISGSTTATLGIANAVEGDSQYLRVSATSSAGLTGVAQGQIQVLAGAIIGEVARASISTDASGQMRVAFLRPFPDSPVVIAQSFSPASGETATVTPIVTNVDATGFGVRLLSIANGAVAGAQTGSIDYVAMRPGDWLLSNGRKASVGRSSIGTVTGRGLPEASLPAALRGWTTVSYRAGDPFAAAPVLLAQLQGVAAAGATCGGLPEYRRVRLQQVQAASAGFTMEVPDNVTCVPASQHFPQSAGWMAFEGGTHALGSGLSLMTRRTAVNVGHAWLQHAFPSSLAPRPRVIAGFATRNDTEGTVIGVRNVGPNSVELRAEEDTTVDSDLTHAAEQVAYVGTNGSYLFTGTPAPGCAAPQIGTQPVGATVTSGATITLSVSATGSGTLAYQWSRGGTPIPGATFSNLTMSPAQTLHAGSYRVTVANACGIATSTAAEIVVTDPTCVAPQITRHPVSWPNLYFGEPYRLEVAATGTPPLQYQWFYSSAAIVGATNPVISATGTNITGLFHAEVRNACSTTVAVSNSALVVVTSQTPYTGQVHRVGDLQQAEDFDLGGEVVAYHECGAGSTATNCITDQVREGHPYRTSELVDVFQGGGGRLGVGWTQPGEWTEYTTAGTAAVPHVVDMMLSSYAPSGTASRVEVGPVGGIDTATASIDVRDTGGWDDFRMVSSRNQVKLSTDSRQAIRATQVGGGVNIDWYRIRPATVADLATPQVQDRFDGLAATDVLNGEYASTDRQWRADSAFVGNDKRWVTATHGTSPVASIVMSPPGSSSIGIFVEASLRPQGTTATWVAVGFANDALGAWSAGPGQVWARVGANGKYNVFAQGGASISGGDQSIPAENLFTATGFNMVRLTYDLYLKRARLYVNGLPVGAPLPIPASFSPDLRRVGVSGNAMQRDLATGVVTAIDDFATGQYVPGIPGCEPPTLTASPASVSKVLGQSLTLSMTATDATTYQWRRDGVPIPGATSAQFTVPALLLTDSGRYDAIAGNTCGSVTSKTATVTVTCTSPTTISSPPAAVDAVFGAQSTLAAGFSGAPSPTITWTKDGQVLPGATASSLVLSGVSKAAEGSYQARAVNACGVATTTPSQVRVISRVAAYPDCEYSNVCLYVDGRKVGSTSPASGSLPVVDFGVADLGTGAVKNGVLVYNEFPLEPVIQVQEAAATNPPFHLRIDGAPPGTGANVFPAVPIAVTLEYLPTSLGVHSGGMRIIGGLVGLTMDVATRGEACDSLCATLGGLPIVAASMPHLAAQGGTASGALTLRLPADRTGTLFISVAGAPASLSGPSCASGSTPMACRINLPAGPAIQLALAVQMEAGTQSLRAPVRITVSDGGVLFEAKAFASTCASGATCVFADGQTVANAGVVDLGRRQGWNPVAQDLFVVNRGSATLDASASTISAPWNLAGAPGAISPQHAAQFSANALQLPTGTSDSAVVVRSPTAITWSGTLRVRGYRIVPVRIGGINFSVETP